MTDLTTASITWDRGQAEVQTLGAMLGPIRFELADGRIVSPLAVAPWGEDRAEEHDALPGILKRLRGEWPCVPFGAPKAPDGLPAHWQPPVSTPVDPDFHGMPSNRPWEIVSLCQDAVTLRFVYPDDHPLDRLERTVRGVAGEAKLHCDLTVVASRDVSTTLALHPVFALAATAGQSRLDIDFQTARSFPMAVEPGVSQILADQEFDALEQVPTAGRPRDLTRLPLDENTEELVQLQGVTGTATLSNLDDHYQATLYFDPGVFPSVLLWVSNRGRQYYPWNGRFTALGIEPLRGAFDLGPDVGAWTSNPIARQGIPTHLSLAAGEVFTTTYSLEAGALKQ